MQTWTQQCLPIQPDAWRAKRRRAERVHRGADKLYPANLTLKELCLVEPLTVGFHAVSRGRVTAEDTVAIFGCGGVGLGAVAAASACGAETICVDVDDEKLE